MRMVRIVLLVAVCGGADALLAQKPLPIPLQFAQPHVADQVSRLQVAPLGPTREVRGGTREGEAEAEAYVVSLVSISLPEGS